MKRASLVERSLARITLPLTSCVILLLFLGNCQSQLPSIPDNLSAPEIFQRAQDAADAGDYSRAIEYYSLYTQKRPDDRERGVWASYEIAFLTHKMGKDDTALTLLAQLLDLYAAEGDALPPAPKILAESLKKRIEENLQKKS